MGETGREERSAAGITSRPGLAPANRLDAPAREHKTHLEARLRECGRGRRRRGEGERGKEGEEKREDESGKVCGVGEGK
ncbi:hypothetical protein E2C01_047338 [Portunus trituberculatus]|uniref:Uncharacterized protein n=1 Tax=Portunus trituberculatus TaxID=210409 RepID=A0A5B7G7B2_PORTR|nr:hypothetical protein [Portunus trituberculatus]